MAIIVFAMMLIFINSISAIAVTENDIKEKQNNLQDIEENIEKAEEKVEEIKEQKTDVVNQLKAVEAELATIKKEETQLTEDIDNVTRELEQTTKRLEKQKAMAVKQEQEMKERLTIMYMNGETSYLELLFEAENMNSFFERIELVKSVVEFDNSVLKELKEIRDAIAKIKDEQTQLKTELVELQTQVLAKKKEIENKKQEYETVKAQLTTQQTLAEDQLDQLEKDSKALEAQIKKLQEELRYAEKYSGGIMTWPVAGYYRITSPFGYRIHPIYGTRRMHTGIDIGSNRDSSGNKVSIYGQKIRAGANGVVILSQYYGGYGECVIIDHGGGVTSLYAHASKRAVSVGQVVKAGQTVSYVGSTGASTGAHLHFEVRKNGTPVDPMGYLK